MKKLTSIREVITGFNKQFLDKSTYKKFGDSGNDIPFVVMQDYRTSSKDVMLRYFNRGGKYSNEQTYVYYPTIVIQDFPPSLDRERGFGVAEVQSNYREEKGIPVGDIVTLPIAMNFKFQVSMLADTKTDYTMMVDWLFANFNTLYGSHFIMKDDVSVYYTAKPVSTGERDDSKFEYIVDFDIKAYVWFKASTTEEAIEAVKVGLEQLDEAETREEFIIN